MLPLDLQPSIYLSYWKDLIALTHQDQPKDSCMPNISPPVCFQDWHNDVWP